MFREGEIVQALYGVASGTLALVATANRDSPAYVHVFHPGDWFGDPEIFERVEHLGTVWAISPCTVCFIPVNRAEALGQRWPELWRCIGSLAADHVRLAIGVIKDLMTHKGEARIAAILLRLGGLRNPQAGTAPVELYQRLELLTLM